MKKFLVLILMLVVMMSSLLAIPASAGYVYDGVFSDPNCGCGVTYTGIYSGGKYGANSAKAWAQVSHNCEGTYSYVAMKCWLAPWSNLNNYRFSTYTDNDYGTTSSHAEVDQTFDSSSVCLLGVENYYKVTVIHNSVEHISQAWSNDGNIPLSYVPPVVTE